MGWTSFNYTDALHSTLTAEKALDFCKQEFETSGYQIKKFWFQKAQHLQDNNVTYLVVQHPQGFNFIMVVLIAIEKGEIYYKDIPASMGPAEDQCPVDFLSMVPIPKNPSYEMDWFIKVRRHNIRYKKQF